MPITPLPAAPNKSTDTKYQFDTKADAFVAALGGFVTEANELEVNVNGKEADAAASAAAALASEGAAAASAASAIAAPGTSATSSTSLSVGTGTKDLVIEAEKDLVVGMKVIIASTAAPTTYMYGTVVAYTPATGALQVSVEQSSGSGTIAAWTVSLTGPRSLALGDGQSWVALYGDRAPGVTYTNGTGRAIMVAVTLYTYSEADQSGGNLVVDGVTVVQSLQKGASLHYETMTAVVPAGATYRANIYGSATKAAWAELR